MPTRTLSRSLMIAIASAGLALSLPVVAQEVDAEAAKLQFRQDGCGKCHHPSRSTMGPALRRIARDYKDAANAEQDIIKFITTPKKIKLEDGSEEEHPVVDSKDPKVISNVARWILSH